MSILDELKKMTRPYDDDDDMLDDEMDMDEGYDEQPVYMPQNPVQQTPVQQAPVQQMPVQPQAQVNIGAQAAAPAMDQLFGGVPASAQSISKYRVVVVKPELFDCATSIADSLRKGDTVILNCENTDKDVARRVIDFLSGCVYAIDGDVKKAGANVYILAPNDVGVAEAEAKAEEA